MTSGAPPCALGLDFGTTSVRAVLVDTRSGADRASLIGRLYARADAEWLAERLMEP